VPVQTRGDVEAIDWILIADRDSEYFERTVDSLLLFRFVSLSQPVSHARFRVSAASEEEPGNRKVRTISHSSCSFFAYLDLLTHCHQSSAHPQWRSEEPHATKLSLVETASDSSLIIMSDGASDVSHRTSKRPRLRHHPLQRRKLKVPASVEELEQQQNNHNTNTNTNTNTIDDDVYEDTLWQDISLFQPRRSRPWPGSQILSSTIHDDAAAARKKVPLLLQSFYQAVGMPDMDSNPQEESKQEEEDANLEDIDNPKFSKLTMGQHRRYMQLTGPQQTDRRTKAERKELHTLGQFVQSEQAAYRNALTKFYTHNKGRYLVAGFTATPHPATVFCRWASSNNKTRASTLHPQSSMPMKFGKCRQVLSLHTEASSDDSKLDVQSLEFQVVHPPSDTNTNTTAQQASTPHQHQLPGVGAKVVPPIPEPPISSPLQDDATAKQLAVEHDASIVTTDETLETLLLLPGDYASRWMIHATTMAIDEKSNKHHFITLLDLPLPQAFLTPRDCLTSGLQEGLYQQAAGNNDNTNKNNKAHHQDVHYRYTVWTLPISSTQQRRRQQQRRVKVLVRSKLRLLDDTKPVKLRAHVEYFSERGSEVPSGHEKALWILDQLLLEHQVTTRFARVDANTCKLLAWEETSVAHAFAGDEAHPMRHFVALLQVLQSIPTIVDLETKSCLLSLPRGSHSVSVHTPVEDDNAVVLDLEPVLEQADTVVTSSEALGHCARDWKWERTDRIAFTFPVTEQATKK
jgi:hypothetical protein